MRVLGIDPGLRLTGFGCVESAPRGAAATKLPSYSRTFSRGEGVRLIEAGVIRLKADHTISDRLAELEADLTNTIQTLTPDAVSVEKLYAHYAHPTTAIVMGHARGIVLLCIRKANLRLVELGATEVKKSLTGNGHASKGQMQESVRLQLGLTARPEPADVADAIAISLCALRRLDR
jgi:crossover junction endodeoxyribonuclease RuvC